MAKLESPIASRDDIASHKSTPLLSKAVEGWREAGIHDDVHEKIY